VVVVTGYAYRGYTDIRIDNCKILGATQGFFRVVVFTLVLGDELQVCFFNIGFGCVLLVDRL